MNRYQDLKIAPAELPPLPQGHMRLIGPNTISGRVLITPDSTEPVNAIFDLHMHLIREAWERGCNMEDLADGYGKGLGTHGDWSGIRDSSHEAIEQMLTRAMNYFFDWRQGRIR